jgi:hypothetical protein
VGTVTGLHDDDDDMADAGTHDASIAIDIDDESDDSEGRAPPQLEA